MRIVVDYGRCTGNAVCVGEAPEVFDVNDDGELEILDEYPDGSLRESAQRAAYMCPTLALTIEP